MRQYAVCQVWEEVGGSALTISQSVETWQGRFACSRPYCRIAEMRKKIGTSMFCLIVSLTFSRASATDILSASSQQQSGAACLSYEPSVVELTGTILRKTFTDAQDNPETYWIQ
jgi:hypothetical protein